LPGALDALVTAPDDGRARLAAERRLLGAVPWEGAHPWSGVCADGAALAVRWSEPAPVRLVSLHEQLTAARGGRAGAIASPPWLARLVVARGLAALGEAPRRVLEPGCGAGAMLVGLIEALGARVGPHDLLDRLCGEEVDAGTASVARRVVWLALALQGCAPSWPLPDGVIAATDAMRAEAEGGFDLVVGNPPYAFGERVGAGARGALAGRFEVGGRGQLDLFRVMWEATLGRVRPGGVHAFVVPDAVVARDELRHLRRLLRREAELVEVVRCGAPFEDGGGRRLGVGAVVVVLRRRRVGAVEGPVRVSEGREGGGGEAAELPVSAFPLDGGPWPIGAPVWWLGPHGLRARLSASGVTVGSALSWGSEGMMRGEEVGRRDTVAWGGPGPVREGVEAVLAGVDVHRGRVGAARLGLGREAVIKARAGYRGPRVLVVKTGATPVAAADEGSEAVLQSVYVLHPAVGGVWDVWALSAVLASAWSAAWALCQWTSGRAVHPQLTQGNVRALPLPSLSAGALEELSALSRRWHELPLDDVAGRAAVEEAMDAAIGRGYGVELGAWRERLTGLLGSLPASQRPRWVTAARRARAP